ncbi:MAG TPA: autotransporter outer membrane beta-barrel domain-containing protein [Brevundimonas sp.]|uniref:autotransporter outer membrane beta-barrel domain-containing protein n=1 Tax=Brevundimonas sp. TaxID=1871086 RepID=UPI002627E447|nr:autotransporter outer membrane beta-barrel domain-containing protein [Brevundimonas sp.]HRO32314.1 autotransporter outer membrane beta-barrel domain-containing protein [Brevundimonas sp.]
MRNLLAAAVAIAPLMAATGTQAEVVINTSRTTPITTANATGSGPDSIRFASGGNVNVTSGVAVTVNSNHGLDLDSGSSISMLASANGSTGILVTGSNPGTIVIGGSVTISDDLEFYPDDDKDGDLDGPWAKGSDRYGLRVNGAGPVTANISIEASGTLLVEGNNSYAVSIESDLVGSFFSLGTMRVTGDNSIAFRSSGDISGGVYLGGPISATGAGSTAVSITGDVGGMLTLQSDISATGYRYTALGSDAFVAGLEPEDKLQSGSAVVIGASVLGGVILEKPPVNNDNANNDEDGDGIGDAAEGTATVNVFGSAPAIVVASDTQDITLGVVGTGDKAFGFINRGSISGQGVYEGVQANGLLFGGVAGRTVDIVGGVRNEGTIASLANKADATTLRFGEGASADSLVNILAISSGVATQGAHRSTAIQIDAGATLNSITNSGQILAVSSGGTADVTAIRDLSGTLTSLTNTGSIQANLSPNDKGDAMTGTVTAIDARANTTGLTLIQSGTTGTVNADNPDTDGDGVPDAQEPEILGDIRLGSGADVLDIRNGVVEGAISFGAGADRLDITGGAVVRGALSDTDGLLDINIANGTLEARQAGQLNVTSLNIGAQGDLLVTLDPANSSNSGFNVSGTATVANGAGVGVRFASLLDGPERFNIISANTLIMGGTLDQAAVQANSPYLYVVSAGADVAAGDIYIDARRRTAQEAGLSGVETSAFDAFYRALGDSDALRNAYLGQTGRDGFINLYEQMLPDHSGGPLLSLASGVDAVTRALTGRNASAAPGETSAWLQEINFYADKDKTDTYGFRSEGFGVAGGIERGTRNGAFGLSVAFTSSDLEDPEAEAEEVLSASLIELGLYWRAQGQYWTTWARAAAGYATFDATRQLVGSGLNLRNESSWNGFTLAAAGGVSYERNMGRWNIRPELYAEYFSLSEDARVERGGGDGFDLDIDERDGHMFSTVAAVNVGYGFGQNGWLRPELRVGWRQNLSVDAGETIARFASGGPDFILSPASIKGGGPMLGLRVAVGNELGMLTIAADAEKLENYVRYTLLLRASFRF